MKVTIEWISVEADTPPLGKQLLFCNRQGSVFISQVTYQNEHHCYVGKHGYFSTGLKNYGDIIAWAELPKSYLEWAE